MNIHDTDVADRHEDPGEAEEDEDAKERGYATSPAPSRDSRKLRKSVSSRPKSPPSNPDPSVAEVLAGGPPSSPATPRASQYQQEHKDSFERVNGRHVSGAEAINAQSADDLPPPLHSRRPPTAPVLDEEFRYCSRDERIKPYRTHHCRTCGTVSESFCSAGNEGALPMMLITPLVVCAILRPPLPVDRTVCWCA